MTEIKEESALHAPALDDGCRLLTLADVEPAARVIAQAFMDDPLCAYMLPFRRTRLRSLTTFFTTATWPIGMPRVPANAITAPSRGSSPRSYWSAACAHQVLALPRISTPDSARAKGTHCR